MISVPESAGPRRGTLVLVVGPSGVGKDSLIAYCRSRLERHGVVFPRRTITRAAGDAFEEHDSLSEDEFELRAQNGGFALSWRAHGLGYGIPLAAADQLAFGRSVVVNVSRAVIGEARRRFSPMMVVAVTVPASVLVERLKARGRESDDNIRERLLRAEAYPVTGPDVVTIDNSREIAAGGDALVRLVESLSTG